MKQGEPSDLISRLAASGEFLLTEEEMTELLDPAKYIGRCPVQVESFLAKRRPTFESASAGSAELNV